MNYQDTLMDISDRVGTDAVDKYYIIERKKHNRVICFRDTPEAIKFIKPKFRHSFLKRCFHRLLTWGFHKLFCNTILLARDLGDVIYLANNVKSFDLENECAYVFEDDSSKMINDLRLQFFLSENGFAPKILFVDGPNKYYREELLYNAELDVDSIMLKLGRFHLFTENEFIHGDFVKDHVKVDRKGNIKFIDWMLRPGKPEEDVKNFAERSQC